MTPREAFLRGFKLALERVRERSEQPPVGNKREAAIVRLVANRVERSMLMANEEYRDFGRPVRVRGEDGVTRDGTIQRTLQGNDGVPVYEVDFGPLPLGAATFGNDVRRIPSKETLVFLDAIEGDEEVEGDA